ncbi:AMP-dependent synthetase and ligase [Moraxella macacae 0408225]|uniref:Long-chain-fatty-acid--CoA ligase n=1 Tax=Moraxella macacae 0408225 TaxID=1230338 RepID=L2FAY3_9GAMM|nr:AMP-binding protein [Moraxella macacae]ELA09593.1 AMP-dependent synthetase and ligase [Moraxella macacae 0408225]
MPQNLANTASKKPVWAISYERYHIQPNIHLPDFNSSLIDLLESRLWQFADRNAYISGQQTLSYHELDCQSKIVANYLQSQGFQTGERIGIMLPNLLHYPIIALGIVRAGMVLVSVNPIHTERELVHQLKDSGIKALFLLDKFQNHLTKITDQLPCLEQVIICQDSDFMGYFANQLSSLVNIGFGVQLQQNLTWFSKKQKLIKRVYFCQLKKHSHNHTYEKPNLTLADVVLVQYTGGTTGVARGAMLTHGNIIANILQIDNLLRSAYDECDDDVDVVLSALPLYHVFSFSICCMLLIYRGFCGLLIVNPRNVNSIIDALAQHPASFILGVNTLFHALLQQRRFRKLDFSHLKATIGGGMAILPKIAHTWQHITGTPIVEGYGLSETAPVVAFNPLTIASFTNKIGIPAPATDVKIINDAEQEVPIGERGEIVVKGPQVMKGYQNLPNETEQSFTKNGYLRTGDIGIMDERGFIKVVDRKKDMILVSGFNVYPNEIEAVMLEHPDVVECVAIGIPSALRGEEPKIFVVKSNPLLSEKALIEFGRQNLTGYKRPRHVAFVDSLPKSAVGKILRHELRKREGLI